MNPEPLDEARHAFRTPVNHVIGYAELLLEELEGSGPADLLHHLHVVLDQGRQVRELIDVACSREEVIHLPRLRQQLQAPLDAIAAACDAIIEILSRAGLEKSVSDVARIRTAVSQLFALVE